MAVVLGRIALQETNRGHADLSWTWSALRTVFVLKAGPSWVKLKRREWERLCLFVSLFVGIKPEKLYSTSCFWREVKPLGVIAHGLRHFYVRETKTAAHTTYLSIDG